jgi:broad specificity phosphatase PhoE
MSQQPLRLVLVRHGLTEWNSLGRWQGHSDIPLSVEGELQAKKLGQVLQHQHFDRVYASDLCRAADTARLAGHQPVLDARLREIHFGELEGITHDELIQHPRFAAGLAQWRKQPIESRLPGGESYQDVLERGLAWLAELPESGTVVAFSHSGFIKVLVPHLLGTTAFVGPQTGTLWWRFIADHTGVSVVERWMVAGEGLWSLYHWNDTSHLRGV